jgi:hypothetical protein
VLLLPVLLPVGQEADGAVSGCRSALMKGHGAPAGPAQGHGVAAALAGAGSSTNSMASSSSSSTAVQAASGIMIAAGGIPLGLWSQAEGMGTAVPGQGLESTTGCSSSSLSSLSHDSSGSGAAISSGVVAPVMTEVGSQGGPGPRCSATDRGLHERRMMSSSSTMTRAEAAMMQHWFGGSPQQAPGQQRGQPAAPSCGTATSSSVGEVGVRAGDHTAWINPAAVVASHVGSTAAATGVWQLHAARSGQYTSAATWGQPWVTCQDVLRGVAAVTFNPGGDAVAVFLEGCYCLVIWKLQSSWTQKLTSLGSSRPSSHLPHAYLPVPLQPAVLIEQQGAAQGWAATAEQLCSWQLKWTAPGLIDLLWRGQLWATVEVVV